MCSTLFARRLFSRGEDLFVHRPIVQELEARSGNPSQYPGRDDVAYVRGTTLALAASQVSDGHPHRRRRVRPRSRKHLGKSALEVHLQVSNWQVCAGDSLKFSMSPSVVSWHLTLRNCPKGPEHVETPRPIHTLKQTPSQPSARRCFRLRAARTGPLGEIKHDAVDLLHPLPRQQVPGSPAMKKRVQTWRIRASVQVSFEVF